MSGGTRWPPSGKWWIVCGLWAVMLGALWVGPRADPWILAAEWTALALLSVAALLTWRPGQSAAMPRCLRRWVLDESGDPRDD